MLAGNPLLHTPGRGSASPREAAAEAGGAYTDHIPTVQAGVLVVAALLLIAFKKAGFRFAVEASAGRG
jgi:hypothetical protein